MIDPVVTVLREGYLRRLFEWRAANANHRRKRCKIWDLM
jgi:hypothetical protein